MIELVPGIEQINWTELADMVKSGYNYVKHPAAKEAVKYIVRSALDRFVGFFRKNQKYGELNEALQEMSENPESKIIRKEVVSQLENAEIPVNEELVEIIKSLTAAIAQTPGGEHFTADTIIKSSPGATVDRRTYTNSTHIELKQGDYIGEQHNYPPPPVKPRMNCYLKDLVSECNLLPWNVMSPGTDEHTKSRELKLRDVYTPMDSNKIEREENLDKFMEQQREAKRLLLEEVINRYPKLVILGDPGSGKSVLVNYFSLVMATATLSKESVAVSDGLASWDHGTLFPVRIILRHFAEKYSTCCEEPGLNPLYCFIRNYIIEKSSEEDWHELFDRLSENEENQFLFFLDGLDEVSESIRSDIVRNINDFADKYSKQRFLVTCRIYAYTDRDSNNQPKIQLNPDFHQVSIAPFSPEQMEQFTKQWYQKQIEKELLPRDTAEEDRSRLLAALQREDIKGLAERPLLLTVLALLNTAKGDVPVDRIKLYDWAVALLFERWERRIAGDEGIVRALNIPGLKIHHLFEGLFEIAFKAHSNQEGADSSTAEISSSFLRDTIQPHLLSGGYDKAQEFVEYIKERAGLLIRRKDDVYTFPHRTFQEFMAGCHYIVSPDISDHTFANLVVKDPNQWRVVAVLAAGYAEQEHRRDKVLNMIHRFCPDDMNDANRSKIRFLQAEIAGEAILEAGKESIAGDNLGAIHTHRIKQWLLAAMQADQLLAPKERVAAGNVLGRLGDPRFNPDNFYLPVEEDLGFERIPAGRFMIGSDKNNDPDATSDELQQREVTIKEFWMARYPVTVVQFRLFLDDSGYEVNRENWCQYNTINNHPVVMASWEDAKAYCTWLTEKLADHKWKIRLPSEAEWEYAAKGGSNTIYSYGKKPDSNKMNYSETKIGSTSPVGCFPGGVARRMIQDMHGNVWEWCEDWYHDNYDGVPTDGSAWVNPQGSFRVLRGGSWSYLARGCRAANRSYNFPSVRYGSFGFRLVRSGE